MIISSKGNRLNIRALFSLNKIFIFVFIFFMFVLTMLFFSKEVLSQDRHRIDFLNKNIVKGINIGDNYYSEDNENLLYALARFELKNKQFLIDDNIVDYKGYFKQLKFRTYTIKKRDTLSSISRKFNINIATLVSFNNIEVDKALRINNQLFIPSMDGILYSVKKEDSLRGIVKKYSKYNVKLGDIIYLNNIVNNKIIEKERLFIPGAKIAKNLLIKKLEHTFAIPAKGRITSLVGMRPSIFKGPKKGYEFHPGVDIKAYYGSPVRAAKSGRIKLAGRVKGYGKVIFINHGNGLQTRYGHLSRILVKRGERVRKRQVIGKVGSTGNSTGPHLHFEVRKYGKVVNLTRKFKGLRLKRGGYWKWN